MEREDLIELGAASIETQGGVIRGAEPDGLEFTPLLEE